MAYGQTNPKTCSMTNELVFLFAVKLSSKYGLPKDCL